MKYIIILDVEHNKEYPFIFAGNLVHKDVAQQSIHLLKRSTEGWKEFKVVAAGMCSILDIQCYEKSETLKIKSRGIEDNQCIEQYNYFHGL